MLETEIGDEDDGRRVAFVAGEVDVVWAFGEALSRGIAVRRAGPVGAVVERQGAGLEHHDYGGSVVCQPKLAPGGTVAWATTTSAGLLTWMV